MAILVTGGAGYIGSHTVIELLNHDYDVVIVDNFSNSHPEVLKRIEQITNKKVTFYKEDILNTKALEEIINQHKIDAVIHFAGYKAVGGSVENPLKYYENNIQGSVSLLKALKACHIKHIVFSSSATVYGMTNQPPLTEDMPTLETANPYGYTKLVVEQLLKDVVASDETWSATILRYFNPVGAHESGLIGEDPSDIPNNLMPYVSQVAVGLLEELSVYGDDYDTVDGTGVRDYIHVVDLAKGHVKALEHNLKQTGTHIYNLGTGKGQSVLEVVRAFQEASGRKVPYKIVPRRLGDVATSFADASKAARELDWRAEKDLNNMCQDAWRWQSQNPHGYSKDV
ncbi:UDP-glucose 4-epimerase GalE [Dolosicoccus paucivorans]|uniref:UDP-glucose 4-epimerase n=1 Tax=Dolosicoccus paucivorans TaxID=84521 RepID=A0A2N6SQA9_9LACT|nr:UDP-glucose 4-epimerase GalE [Dolosicoccus paucivorans]PMB84646.1 UDP-glucose 4-epimerase GalE [Dolosicoccus paucivorans]PMC59250.1 UDP-glucose 4-epimerase GalE [Dolosicoccus paucivorans]